MTNNRKLFNNITFVIHPTEYSDYDCVAIGVFYLLEQLSHKEKHFHLIKKSKFGGIPILILDTCDTISQANHCIKEYRKLYSLLTKNCIVY